MSLLLHTTDWLVKLKNHVENLDNIDAFKEENKHTNKLDIRHIHTCNPGCSQNNGTDPRICMKEETQSSRYITYKKRKNSKRENPVNHVLERQLLRWAAQLCRDYSYAACPDQNSQKQDVSVSSYWWYWSRKQKHLRITTLMKKILNLSIIYIYSYVFFHLFFSFL